MCSWLPSFRKQAEPSINDLPSSSSSNTQIRGSILNLDVLPRNAVSAVHAAAPAPELEAKGGQDKFLGAQDMANAGARAYNGGLGAEPPAGPRGRAPGQGIWGQSPPPRS